MSTNISFNYIITIYNKEDLIGQVLENVIKCCGENSHIYPVLDGCTDNSEKIIDEIISKNSNIAITKVYENNVHELLTINAGLKAANHEGEGYNIILQDDVVLGESHIESHIINIYSWASNLAYLSFRLGADFKKNALDNNEIVPFDNYIENAAGHGIPDANMLPIGTFCYCDIPIKSPVCIPFHIIRKYIGFDERLAPYAHDDTELAIRLLKDGYQNGVFALKFISDLEWGGTRQSPHPEIAKVQERNIDYIREWHGAFLTELSKMKRNRKIYDIPKVTNFFDKEISDILWNHNVNLLENKKTFFRRIIKKIKNLISSKKGKIYN